jgi:hypothetical protein
MANGHARTSKRFSCAHTFGYFAVNVGVMIAVPPPAFAGQTHKQRTVLSMEQPCEEARPPAVRTTAASFAFTASSSV